MAGSGVRGLEDFPVRIDAIYVPAGKRRALDAERVAALAESILENGQQTPILVRRDADHPDTEYVLIEGLHRLEACKALGEETIAALLVRARQH